MTDQERQVIDLLRQAYNAHVQLPVIHPDDQEDFCQMINRLQDMVAARPHWIEENEKSSK